MKTTIEEIVQFSLIQGEPVFMQNLRKKSFDLIEKRNLPAIERVNYHRWNLFHEQLSEELATGNIPDFEALANEPLLVQTGAQTVLEQLPMELVEQGVILTSLHDAMAEYPELVEKYYMSKAVKIDEDKLTAWHAAFMNSGVFVYVPKNVHLSQTMTVICQQNANSSTAFNKHILIVADENSSFSYLERFETVGEKNKPTSANIVVEVMTEAGAKVKYTAIDRLGENVTTFIARRGHLGRDSAIEWNIGVMNDGNVVADFDSDLVGTGSQALVKAVAISSGKQVQGIDTRVTNFSSHSVGHILQHGVILEQGTLTFNGIGHILKGAKGADAKQETRVLMLSDKARGDANPILLIDENEVTAGHAASIGRVDPEEMYYLMSRGIDEKTAQRLVIRGFLGSVIAGMPNRSVQEEFIQMIEGKLSCMTFKKSD